MAYLRLKRLKIEKYRGVAPNTELVFNDGMNVLLGRNGTGKTTLLQLIAIVTRSAFGALVGEEFSFEYDVSFDQLGFRVSLSNRAIESAPKRSLIGWRFAEGSRADWAFAVSLILPDRTLVPILQGTPTGVSTPLAEHGGRSIAVRDPLRDVSPVEQAVDLLLELSERFDKERDDRRREAMHGLVQFALSVWKHQASLRQQGGRFDEGLGTFGGIVGNPAYLSVDDPDRAVMFYSLDGKRASGYFTPDVVELAAVRHMDAAQPGDLVIPHEELPFLQRTIALLGGTEAKLILKLEREQASGDAEKTTATFSDFEFLLTMDDGTVLRHDWLSFGQKRLLSFLYYVATNPDIIIADELVNGLHHEWIQACFEEIKDRQCFLTSQNPLLLDYLEFDSVESVKRTFILCDRKKNGRRAQLLWGNMEDDSATGFFRAYKAGVQHVSEILRTKGLW